MPACWHTTVADTYAVAASASGSSKRPAAVLAGGSHENSIISFVTAVTDKSGADYVPPAERIATFDNDGTLWSEKPVYFQLLFAIDRIKALAPQHPEWKTQQPFKAVLEDDHDALADAGEKGLLQLVMASHSGMTTEEFSQMVGEWLASAQHPRFKRPYTELVYQPMLVRLPEINFIDDKAGKPVGINQYIGRRPIAAFGNSDGDLQMLQWTSAGDGRRFMLLVHHTDAEREWAYDRDSHVGRLDKALLKADKHGWTVVDMKQDWKQIYPANK